MQRTKHIDKNGYPVIIERVDSTHVVVRWGRGQSMEKSFPHWLLASRWVNRNFTENGR